MHTSIQLGESDFGPGALMVIHNNVMQTRTMIVSPETLAAYPRDRFLSACVAYLRSEGFDVNSPTTPPPLDAVACLEQVRELMHSERDRVKGYLTDSQHLGATLMCNVVEEQIDNILKTQEVPE